MKVSLQSDGGIMKDVKVGFSWTIFFFSGLPFLFRGMPLMFVVTLVGNFFTFGIAGLILAFIGNKMTATHYIEKGYKKTGDNWHYANSKWNMTGLPNTTTPQPTTSQNTAAATNNNPK